MNFVWQMLNQSYCLDERTVRLASNNQEANRLPSLCAELTFERPDHIRCDPPTVDFSGLRFHTFTRAKHSINVGQNAKFSAMAWNGGDVSS